MGTPPPPSTTAADSVRTATGAEGDPTPSTGTRWGAVLRWTALAVAVGYTGVRTFWALGGRWGRSWCGRAVDHDAAAVATGCAADAVGSGGGGEWRMVAACAVGVIVAAVLCVRSRGWAMAGGAAAAAAAVALSFPGHLLFEIPAGLAGRVTDWRDVGHRILLLGAGLALAGSVWSRRSHGATRPTMSTRGLRRWSHLAAVIPVLGFTVPHLLWFLGIPAGIDPAMVAEIRANLNLTTDLALLLGPVAGAVLTTGLGHRWGRQVPSWVPGLGGRRIPRMLALVPASVITVALTSYGVLGLVIIGRALAEGSVSWAELVTGWAVSGTEVVFLLWGLALGVATVGYAGATAEAG